MKILLFIVTLGTIRSTVSFSKDTLELLHVVFRHGQRHPDSIYPKEIYTKETFYPEGLGELTNQGKLTMYNVGKSIRESYDEFLGDVVTPDLLYGLASSRRRCETSVLAMYAGMFPPKEMQVWNPALDWQPLTYTAYLKENNYVFVPAGICPNIAKFSDEYLLNYRNDSVYLQYPWLEEYLWNNTGYSTNLFPMSISLYNTLRSEEQFGLELPEWTKLIYPSPLKEAEVAAWKYYAGMGKIQILQSGYLLSKIMENTDSKVNGVDPGKKIFLYSGHNINVGGLLFVLDSYDNKHIVSGAHIIIEIHNVFNVRFVRVLYQNYDYEEPIVLNIPNCGSVCPLDWLKQLYSDYLDVNYLNELCGN